MAHGKRSRNGKGKPSLPTPITWKQLRGRKPVSAVAECVKQAATRRLGSFFISTTNGRQPQISTRIDSVDSGENNGQATFRVEIDVTGAERISAHSRARHPVTVFSPRDFPARTEPGSLDGYRPEFLELRFFPRQVTQLPARPKVLKGKKRFRPLLIFPPDRRYICDLTSYPWCTVGRAQSPNGIGTGVMIGRWLMLTASHVADWTHGPSSFSWVTFAPAYSNGNTPFGVANAVASYAYRANPKTMDEFQVAEDYAIFVLDQPLGDQVGFMGWREYTEDWDDTPYWSQIGYADDLGGGEWPSFQNQVSFSDADNPGFFGQGDGVDIESESCSLSAGDSGGPFFGWWDNEPWPRVVGVTSSDGDGANWGAGGDPLSRIIEQARNDHS
jgi:V8-like Glu-specific endopeptidase